MTKQMEMPKIQTRLEVKNEASEETAELYLYGVIRQAFWWDGEESCISAKEVRQKLESLKGKDINVHLNSNGGDVFESIAICNLLKQHDGAINIFIDAMAASGASIIATAGKNVYMYANSMQMVHKSWTIASGNTDEFRKIATDLDKIDTSVKASYMSKFVGTEDELEKLVGEETYLAADECLAFGLCSEILKDAEEEPDEPDEPQGSIKESLCAKYRKEPPNNEEPPAKGGFFNFKKTEVSS